MAMAFLRSRFMSVSAREISFFSYFACLRCYDGVLFTFFIARHPTIISILVAGNMFNIDMKNSIVLLLGVALSLGSCGTYTGQGAATGATFGSILGSAIGGITGGPRGSDIGTVVGMAGGAEIGDAHGLAVELLLLDEPFAAIDAKVRQELRSWLRDMITKVGITSIFVTHDQDEAIEVADEIIVTSKGHIEQIGTPRQIYREPETAFMAEFMGHPVHVDQINKIKGFNQLDDSVKAVLRPENVNITRLDEKIDSAASVEKGVVVDKLFMGKEVEITVNVNGIEVVGTRNVEEAPIKKGEEVNVFIHRAFTYGADGIVNIVENANKFEDWMVI